MRKFLKIIMVMASLWALIFGITVKVSEATIVPGNSMQILSSGYITIDDVDGFQTFRSYTVPVPSGIALFSIKGKIKSGGSNGPKLRVLVDGAQVYYLDPIPDNDYMNISLTELNGKVIEVQAERNSSNYYSRRLYFGGGSLVWGADLADEEARDAAIDAKNAANSAKASADAAHMDAQNAANRTWYNGNESA
ncbi:MAG: hypothetical protein FH756_17580 [Firmicutes bacterium]|nr:hypothetical protein [Bacillota bacterium]